MAGSTPQVGLAVGGLWGLGFGGCRDVEGLGLRVGLAAAAQGFNLHSSLRLHVWMALNRGFRLPVVYK